MSAIGSERLKMARRRLSTLVCATARDIATDEIAPARKFRRFMGFVRQAEESLAEYSHLNVDSRSMPPIRFLAFWERTESPTLLEKLYSGLSAKESSSCTKR
jgi:hypothetical protein